MLELKNLRHSYGDHAIAYPDWKVDGQGHALMLGASGSGKTTLLHIVSGLLKPTEGDVIIDGQNIGELSTAALDRYRGANIGIVFQRPHLIRSLSVMENLQLAAYLSGKKVTKAHYAEVLESLDMTALAYRKVHQLSEGQAQRVSIARAVIHQPRLLAADEPTASLDDANSAKVVKLLKDQATACGAMLIIATHDARVKSEFANQLTL